MKIDVGGLILSAMVFLLMLGLGAALLMVGWVIIMEFGHPLLIVLGVFLGAFGICSLAASVHVACTTLKELAT